jgi:phosphoenolpyruvate phosphomutase
MKRPKLLKELINTKNLEFLMEAHNGVSAKIAEETGFKGIWASSLSISASLGARDNNELSWTQVLDIVEFMTDVTSIPVLVDADTGYGNFNNVMRLVKKMEQRNVAGLCIEDKIFPKKNSFLSNSSCDLETIEEFTSKIKAAKDSQSNPDFIVVARTEAFIVGAGLSEALKRAEAYKNAGADAILIHSKKSKYTEIKDFMLRWKNFHPIIIVPTKYFSTPTDDFRKLQISLIIWANHLLRAAIKGMQLASKKIFLDQAIEEVEKKIVPVEEIFRLQNVHNLEELEMKYYNDFYGKTRK